MRTAGLAAAVCAAMALAALLPDEAEPMTQGWDIKERLDHAVDAVIDSGECGAVPTTVIDFSQAEPEIVRRGAGDPALFE